MTPPSDRAHDAPRGEHQDQRGGGKRFGFDDAAAMEVSPEVKRQFMLQNFELLALTSIATMDVEVRGRTVAWNWAHTWALSLFTSSDAPFRENLATVTRTYHAARARGEQPDRAIRALVLTCQIEMGRQGVYGPPKREAVRERILARDMQ